MLASKLNSHPYRVDHRDSKSESFFFYMCETTTLICQLKIKSHKLSKDIKKIFLQILNLYDPKDNSIGWEINLESRLFYGTV